MNIRFAKLDDVSDIVEVGRRLHAETRFAAYDFNAERVAENLRGVIEIGQNGKGTHCFFVAEDSHGKSVGALIGCIERHFFSDQPVATVIQYGVIPEKRMGGTGLRLLTAFRNWAKNRDAFELSVGVNSGVDMAKTDRLLRKLGFQQTGGNYAMPLRKES